MNPSQPDEAKKPIFVLDKGEPMPLYPKEINGVVVYTPSEEKTKELNERYRSLLPPQEPKKPKPVRSLKWPSFVNRWFKH